MEQHKEYIRWTDGSVVYIVYDNIGNPSPGAKVSGMPGVLVPTKVYTADAEGKFIITKEELPENKSQEERYNSVTVEYLKSTGETVTETSARNTYVPNRMQIRLRLSEAPRLQSDSVQVPFVVERRPDSSSSWEPIPSHLGDLIQTLTAYKLDDESDPTSFTTASTKLATQSVNIYSDKNISVVRFFKKEDYVTNNFRPSQRWDGNDIFFTLSLSSYYGETPQTNAVVKMAPIHLMLPIKDIKATNYYEPLETFERIEGRFDVANIDYSILFEQTYGQSSNGGFDLYEPRNIAKSVMDDLNILRISFTYTTDDVQNSSTNYLSPASINNHGFLVEHARLTSVVSITIDRTASTNNWHFLVLWTIGDLVKENDKFIIQGRSYSYNIGNLEIELD